MSAVSGLRSMEHTSAMFTWESTTTMLRRLEPPKDPIAAHQEAIRKPVLIKLGSTLPALQADRGDFVDWILEGLALAPQDVVLIDPTAGDALPVPEGLAGIILTGSHAMVTDRAPWSERTAAWLREAVVQGVPILGICYGHQLLAHALGGIVADNPNGREFGTIRASLSAAAQSDRLLGGFGASIEVQTSHTQSVTRLPPGARLLASSALDPHLAYAIGDRVWGIQFHPEFDATVVKAYVEATRERLIAEGRDPDQILRRVKDTPVGSQILRRFVDLVAEHGDPASSMLAVAQAAAESVPTSGVKA